MDDKADLLTELGLSNYEARAYVELVRGGAMTADEVATESDIPQGRVYDVLNSLSDRSLVRTDDGRPRTYVHIEPEEATDRLLDRRIDELSEQRTAYERTASAAADALSEISSTPTTEGFTTSALHEEAARELLLERLATVGDSVYVVADTIDVTPDFQAAFADRLRDLLEIGVSVRLVATDFERAGDWIGELIDLGMETRRAERVPEQRFIVLDDSEVCLEVVNPAAPDELLAVVNFREDDTVYELVESFDELWAEAEHWTPA